MKNKILIKIISFFLFVFVIENSNGQQKSIRVTYKKVAIIDKQIFKDNPEKYSKAIAFKTKQNDLLSDVEFYLDCNASESVFQVNDILNIDGDKWKRMYIKLGGGGDIIYTNIKEMEQLWKKEAFGSIFLIENDITNYKWELTSESKTIQNYTCYKAIGQREIKKDVFVPIIAWYTPELSYPFGPIEYCNLPGLILELETSENRFYAVNISFIPSNVVIKKPSKGKRVTYKELVEIGKKMRNKHY